MIGFGGVNRVLFGCDFGLAPYGQLTKIRLFRMFVTDDEFEWDDEKAARNLIKH